MLVVQIVHSLISYDFLLQQHHQHLQRYYQVNANQCDCLQLVLELWYFVFSHWEQHLDLVLGFCLNLIIHFVCHVAVGVDGMGDHLIFFYLHGTIWQVIGEFQLRKIFILIGVFLIKFQRPQHLLSYFLHQLFLQQPSHLPSLSPSPSLSPFLSYLFYSQEQNQVFIFISCT